jgi:membrane protein implicated in regulation of membrane protease activity
LLGSWSLLTLPAILVIFLRLATAAHFAWSNPVYLAIENPHVWHLGFWEWIGSAAVFLFLASATLFLPRHTRLRRAPRVPLQ